MLEPRFVRAQNFEPLRAPRQNTTIHTPWQRNFYEHIIRDEKSHVNMSEYIINNPVTWREDRYYG